MPAPPPESEPAIVSARGRGAAAFALIGNGPNRSVRADVPAVAVDRGDAGALDDAADLRERSRRTPPCRSALAASTAPSRHRREQLVVFAAAQCVLERRARPPPARRRARVGRPRRSHAAGARGPRPTRRRCRSSRWRRGGRARPASPTRAVGRRWRRDRRALLRGRGRRPQRMSRRPAALPPSSPVTTTTIAEHALPSEGPPRPGATSPVTVTAIDASRPRERSPPTSHSAYSSHASRIPPNSSITHAASTSAEASVRRPRHAGSLPSPRCRSRSRRSPCTRDRGPPTDPGRSATSSTSASVVMTRLPPVGARTAASSPTPTRTSGPAPGEHPADRLEQLVLG